MREIGRRLAALEARAPKAKPQRAPLSRDERECAARMGAAIVTHFLGEWSPGADAFAALEVAMERSTSTYCKPDLAYAVMQIEWKIFGCYSQANTLDHITELWNRAGGACDLLYEEFAGLFDHYPELDWIAEPPGTPSFMGLRIERMTA